MNIYIGSLSTSITSDDLKNAFEAYGKVDDVKIITDRYTGEARGFAFVEMPTKAEAVAAIEGLNGSELKGSTIVVNEARPRSDSRGRGGKKRSW
ncbi:MAG: RNA-binding protein [Deltaproteobacteria bacterium]|nr:RNA-binding protein [Deltaproteobacteria bacterium]